MSVEIVSGAGTRSSLSVPADPNVNVFPKKDLVEQKMDELSQRENVSKAKQTFNSILAAMAKSTTELSSQIDQKINK